MTFSLLTAPSSLRSSGNAGEPSLGVNDVSGALMYQARSATYKIVIDPATGAATWSDVTPPGALPDFDPILATDRDTGRTFAGGLQGACSVLHASSNDGASWTPTGNACANADHESVVSGPWRGGPPLGASDSRAVYYCSSDANASDTCATSGTGGTSFGPPILVTGGCRGIHGHIKIAPNGIAYLPVRLCGAATGPVLVGGGITMDNGTSWGLYTIPGSSRAAQGFDPSVTITPDNTVYEAWQQGGNHPFVARSVTAGTSWDRVTDLSGTVAGSPIVNSTFQAATSGDNGQVAVAFLGSTTAGDPFTAGWPGVWDLYVASSIDAGVTWSTVKVTSDPVQRGYLCTGGASCTGGRNLLDFMDANLTRDCRVVVGFSDGCVGTCAGPGGTEGQSTSALPTVAYQTGGPLLRLSLTPSPSQSPTVSGTPSPNPGPSASPSPTPAPSDSFGPPPSPSAAPSPTSSATSSPTSASSPTPSASAREVAPSVSLSASVISAGQRVTVTYRGQPNTTLSILSKTQPATAYTVIRTVTLDNSGFGTSSHAPRKNTRIMARTASGLVSGQPLIQVRSIASINVLRLSALRYSFRGTVSPALAGRGVSLRRNGVQIGFGKTDGNGVYSILVTLPRGGANYLVRTGNDTYNVGATSRTVSFTAS